MKIKRINENQNQKEFIIEDKKNRITITPTSIKVDNVKTEAMIRHDGTEDPLIDFQNYQMWCPILIWNDSVTVDITKGG